MDNRAHRALQMRAEFNQQCGAPAMFDFEGWLLRHGDPFERLRPVAPHELMAIKQCFSNSLEALAYDRVSRSLWAYTEGMVVTTGIPIPIHHAWLTNREGEVLDLTLRDAAERGAHYWGIPFDFDFAMSQTLEQGFYGLFCDGMTYLPLTQRPVGPERAWPQLRAAA